MKNIVATLLVKYMGCNMNIKLHVRDSHLYFFQKISEVSEEQQKRFHQNYGN